MIRATTPVHELKFEDDILRDAVQILVTYKQGSVKRNVIWAGGNTEAISVDFENQIVTVSWSQEQTKAFAAERDVELQVRIVNDDSEVAASTIVGTRVFKVLDDMELGGQTESTEGWKWEYELTPGEAAELYDDLSISVDSGESLTEWDYTLSQEEARSLAQELKLEYSEGWDMLVSSFEAARIGKILGIGAE